MKSWKHVADNIILKILLLFYIWMSFVYTQSQLLCLSINISACNDQPFRYRHGVHTQTQISLHTEKLNGLPPVSNYWEQWWEEWTFLKKNVCKRERKGFLKKVRKLSEEQLQQIGTFRFVPHKWSSYPLFFSSSFFGIILLSWWMVQIRCTLYSLSTATSDLVGKIREKNKEE